MLMCQNILIAKELKSKECFYCLLHGATTAICVVGFLLTTYGTACKYFSDSKLTSLYYLVMFYFIHFYITTLHHFRY